MKKQFFIANWKSHKTLREADEFVRSFAPLIHEDAEKEIIICPPFPLMEICKTYIDQHHLSIKLGAQDVSSFGEGSYTGEIAARSLLGLAEYVIIGHSERREYFHETDQVLVQKTHLALANNLTPIFCVSSDTQKIPDNVRIVAFEPLDAIGTGKPKDPDIVENIARSLHEKNDVSYILYGGSVTSLDVSHYTRLPSINGVLVGGASLDPESFANLIQHA